MNQLVDALERESERSETINALFREAHSIKGMAAAMQFKQTAAVAHHLEHYLGEIRSSLWGPRDVRDRLLEGIDQDVPRRAGFHSRGRKVQVVNIRPSPQRVAKVGGLGQRRHLSERRGPG